MIIRIIAFIAVVLFFIMFGLALIKDLRNNHRKIDKSVKNQKKRVDANKKQYY